jgi:hypothetical protein
MTLAPNRDADADALALALAGVADQDVYVAVVGAVLPVLVELEARRAATGIVEDIAKRVPLFKDVVVSQLAPVVARLQTLTSVDPVVSAVQAIASAALIADIAAATSVIRAFVEAKVAGAAALPPALAEHGAALGTIDLDQAAWLLRQKGVRRDNVRTALVSLIRTEPASTIAPTLQTVRRGLGEGWQIGKALVERAAASPDGSRDEWLILAEPWNVPPAKGQRQNRDDYRDALDRAAQDPGAQATAAKLRGKL